SRDAEVGTDPTEDVVDRQSPERALELRRTPPPITLQRMITEVDEATVESVPITRCLIDPAGQPGDATCELCLGICTRDEPGLGAVTPTLRDQRLDGGQRHHQVTEAERNGRDVDATHSCSSRLTRSGWAVLGDVVDLQRREGVTALGALVTASAVP